ncbi:hypothetical protein DMUE_4323 [Dictyocoela muelleri]|nr:hypothetical protein DMUE_4323 [Dictyocoela muelleri]
MKFLKENDAIIDFKYDKFNLHGREYKPSLNKNDICRSDSRLIDASRTYKVSTDNENFNKIIENYKSKNHLLGNIAYPTFNSPKKTIFLKILKYSVPMGIRENVKQHISELIKTGIISESTSNYISSAFVLRKKEWEVLILVDYLIYTL